MKKLFGTDGIRGLANAELTPEIAFALGCASAYVLTNKSKHTPRIIIGMDTRISCDMLEAAYTSGACSVGARVAVAGVIPTPAIPVLIRKYGFDAGVVISASHNSFEDNGIKLFDSNGYKLPDSLEEDIEKIILNDEEMKKLPRPVGAEVGRREEIEDATDDYIHYLKETLTDEIPKKQYFQGMKIVIDCANGAVYKAAPLIFFELGAEVIVIHNEPDGKNINQNCGSTHMGDLVAAVKENKADIGLAFDGDGDRFLAVDENGMIVEGDQIMSICANELKSRGELKKNTLVATVMSNLGLFQMGAKQDIKIEKTSVGDRYVLEKMLECGYNFGGENSGHIIFLMHNTTGDGILTALKLLQILKRTGQSLSNANHYMKVLPQVLINVRVCNEKKEEYLNNKFIMDAIKEVEDDIADTGRILIRASGTEALVRVMLEGHDMETIKNHAEKIASMLKEAYGA